MVPIQNVKMTVGPIWNTGGTETEISVPVSVLGPQRAGTEMGGDLRKCQCHRLSVTVSVTDTGDVVPRRSRPAGRHLLSIFCGLPYLFEY